MAQVYAYTTIVDKLRDFIKKLQQVGKPAKVDWRYVQSLGYKSSNARPFPRILRMIGLIDAGGQPTDRWTALREADGGPARLGSYIKEAYCDLFDVYPDAHRQGTEVLANFFRARTGVGERAIQAIVGTFQTVCSFASFEAAPAPEEAPDVPVEEQAVRLEKPLRLAPGGLTVNVNIQLELPATTDEDVYERLFSAMERHILKFGEG